MKLAARVEDVTKTYDLGPALIEPLGGAKQDLNFAPVSADEGRILVRALRGVTLDFPEGDFVAIMGASGSGKSTLLNLLGGLDRPTTGNYILDGIDVSQMDDAALSHMRNSKLGFIFQSYNLIAQYTVLENIELPLHYRAGYPPIGAAEQEHCLRMAQKVGLGERLDHRPFQLSGGQQQRVAIARALVNNPEIILADEPTGNLDSATSHEIMEMLISLNKEGRTIIMVTHEPDIANWARRQIVMRDGLVYKEALTADIVAAASAAPREAFAAH
ncbi:MAG: ABC transporter ATP-binding protein [Planctomycetia bacterium]|nr:ABC transporter ATP-binding protein [Planctomycetia bacterium]